MKGLRILRAMPLAVIAMLLVAPAEAAPVLVVDDPVWSLGIVIDSQRYDKTVVVENAGDEPLVIEKIEECCGFYGKLDGNSTLLPGEKVNLKLTVKTFKQVGDLRAELFLYSNDPTVPKYSVFALGQVVPKQHALGELTEIARDLGVIDVRERVPFTLKVRNAGNQPLTIRKVERPPSVFEAAPIPVVEPGAEVELRFEYLAEKPGPIEDRLVLSSNDALERALVFQLKGYVSAQHVPDRALLLYPVGKQVVYEPGSRSYVYRFTFKNGGGQEVEILKMESSLPVAHKEWPKRVAAGESADGAMTLAPEPGQVPAKGYVYFQLAVPVEIR